MQKIPAAGCRYDSKYDILKLCLALFVVAIHTNLFPMVLYPWLRIAVPMFFMLTSYFFFQKIQNRGEEEQKKIRKTFVLRNIRLYVFWFVVCLPVTLILRKDRYLAVGLWSGLAEFLRSLFFGSTFMASWYISSAVIGVLVIYFLTKKNRWHIALLVSALSFVFVTLYSSYYAQFPSDGLFVRVAEVCCAVLNVPTGTFLTSVLWIFLGKCFAENKLRFPSLWHSWVLLAVSCVGLYAEWRYGIRLSGAYHNDSYFMLLPVCVCLFDCFQKIKPVYFPASKHFKRLSTVTYALHGSVAVVLISVLEEHLAFDISVIVFVLTLACCAAVYLAIAAVIRKFPNSKAAKLLQNAY